MSNEKDKTAQSEQTPTRSNRGSYSPASWCSERFLALLEELGIQQHLESGLEYFQKRRVLDFLVIPGRISAKVQADEGKPFRVAFAVSQLTDTQWDQVFQELAKRSLFAAKLLAGEIPAEVEEAFRQVNAPLFPTSPKDLRVFCDCEDRSPLCKHLAALYYRFARAVDTDPFLLFAFRGRGRDETILELRKHRSNLSRAGELETPPSYQDESTVGDASTAAESANWLKDPNEFWMAGQELKSLSYTIRADELPAAVLRRLEPLPLGGLEEFVESYFEDAYAQVARRAQVFGLALRPRSTD